MPHTRGRAAKGTRLAGPLVNWDHPQAVGLIDLYSGRPTGLTEVRRRPITKVGTFLSASRVAVNPLNDVLLEHDQGGGNITGATFPVSGVTASDPLTVTTWIYITQAPGAPRGIWDLGATWSLALTHTKGTSGTLRAHVVTTSGGAAQFNTGDTTTALAPFKPLLAIVVWKPGAGLTLYINGRAEASNGTATTGLRDVDVIRPYAAPSAESTAGLEGALSDFRMYRRAFTAADAWDLYVNPRALYQQRSTRVFFDVGAASGSEGALSVTLAALTASATGAVALVGATTATLADVTATAAAALALTGAASVALDALTASATGALSLVGGVSVTLDALTANAAGIAVLSGASSVTLENLSASATGTVSLAGTSSGTLDPVTSSAAGALAVVGQLSSTLDAVTLSAEGTGASTGSLTQTLEPVTVTAAGTVALSGVTTATLEALSMQAAGVLSSANTGTLAGTLAPVTATAVGVLAVTGQVGVILDPVVTSNLAAWPEDTHPARVTFARPLHRVVFASPRHRITFDE